MGSGNYDTPCVVKLMPQNEILGMPLLNAIERGLPCATCLQPTGRENLYAYS